MASNTAMIAPLPADERLNRLEEKACFTDDLLDHLNRQVAAQQAQIDLLLREVRRLRQQVDNQAQQSGGAGSLRDELPPHY